MVGAAVISAAAMFSTQSAIAGGDIIEAPVSHPTIWKGFYFGGHIGLAESESELDIAAVGIADLDDTGFAGGIHLGYNWQRGKIVYGIEVDYTFTDLEYSVAGQDLADIDGVGSVRARLGYSIDSLLLFATAGFAWHNADVNDIVSDFVDLDNNGYVLGAGAEYKFGNKYSFKLEALHYSFDEDEIVNTGLRVSTDIDSEITVVRTGLSMHF